MPLDARQRKFRFPTPPVVIDCAQCGEAFEKTRKHRPTRKFCDRNCYRESMRNFESVPYPVIWHNGKREYLHRVIYMLATGETLTGDEIVHHKDENPFNRDPANLEKMPSRLDYLKTLTFADWERRRRGWGLWGRLNRLRQHLESMKATVTHYYKCFGCGKRHDAKDDAITCCAVVQEVFGCTACDAVFPTEPRANRHLQIVEKQIGELTNQFYAAAQAQTFDGISAWQ